MREILFRGKRVDNGEWVEGYYIKATRHWHEHGIHEDWIAVDTIQNGGWCNVRSKYAVIPESVSEFTGLTDKNGKKIFEGDIVNVKSLPFNIDLRGYVFFEKNSYKVKTLRYSTVHLLGETYIENDMGASIEVYHKYEVIGNIHDNPELLS